MNPTGIMIGLFTLIAIALGFVGVIKLEYYIGAQIARAVAVTGAAFIVGSLFISDLMLSSLTGVFGGVILWGAVELPAQEKRVAGGMFPANPNKRAGITAKPPPVYRSKEDSG